MEVSSDMAFLFVFFFTEAPLPCVESPFRNIEDEDGLKTEEVSQAHLLQPKASQKVALEVGGQRSRGQKREASATGHSSVSTQAHLVCLRFSLSLTPNFTRCKRVSVSCHGQVYRRSVSPRATHFSPTLLEDKGQC